MSGKITSKRIEVVNKTKFWTFKVIEIEEKDGKIISKRKIKNV